MNKGVFGISRYILRICTLGLPFPLEKLQATKWFITLKFWLTKVYFQYCDDTFVGYKIAFYMQIVPFSGGTSLIQSGNCATHQLCPVCDLDSLYIAHPVCCLHFLKGDRIRIKMRFVPCTICIHIKIRIFVLCPKDHWEKQFNNS